MQFSLIQAFIKILNLFALGTIHKQRQQFFRIFDTPLPHVGSFLLLFVGNFDQFLTPSPPLNCRRRLWRAPHTDFI